MNPARRDKEKYLQQICSLGMHWQVSMPTILDTLHGIVPSYANVYFATDSQGEVTNIYDEHPDAESVIPVYTGQFFNRQEREVFVGWRPVQDFRTAVDFDHLMTVDRSRFLRHGFYNEVLRPVGFFYGAHVNLRQGSSFKGYLQLKRKRSDGRFSSTELRRIDRISRFISHTLDAKAPEHEEALFSPEVSDQGLVIANADGDIEHISRAARRMLYLSCSPSLPGLGRSVARIDTWRLPAPLVRLCKAVSAIAQNILVPEPPSYVTRNTWGEFRFHAYLLEPSRNDVSNPLIGLSISKYEPIAGRVLAAVEPFKLTTRQIQTCVLLAKGLTAAEIAARLGVRESTVISHRKEIYGRVNVKNRAELLSRLIAGGLPSVDQA